MTMTSVPASAEHVSALLTDIVGRDKILRTCGFTAGFISSLSTGVTARKFKTIQSQISSCRVVFRLLGDIPIWVRARRSNFGKSSVVSEVRNPMSETVSVLNMGADILYSLVEHVAWAAQNGLVPASAGKWSQRTTMVWVVSLILAVIKSANNLTGINIKLRQLSLNSQQHSKQELHQLNQKATVEKLNLIRSLSDLMCAVNSLPQGYLWGQRLSSTVHCFFGIVASVTGVVLVRRNLFPPKPHSD